LQLQRDLLETQLAEAYYHYFIERDYDRARQIFELAHQQSPNNSEAPLALALIGSAAPAVAGGSPVGTWSTANGHGVIAIAECGDALCGRIVGIDRDPLAPIRPTCMGVRSAA